jgi:trans-2,3-dihydro-3-hydroxyanthranilate isomerase
MIDRLKFYILDVFAEKKYSGNQLAVFRHAEKLTDDEMLLLAREMNYSESTFILSDQQEDGGFPVRIFTPAEEVPFAGHPTLGTAYVIQQALIKEPVERLVLNLQVGKIPVNFSYQKSQPDVLRMEQKEPVFGEVVQPETAAGILSLHPDDIDHRFPVQEVSTGLPFFIVPLKDLATIKRSQIQKNLFFDFIKTRQAKAFLLFCPETYHKEHHLNARVYVDYYGIPEDPATGSANGCLAGYLVRYRYFGDSQIDITVEQGYEIQRPSLLYLRASENRGKFSIMVGGKVKMTAEGYLV